MISLATSDRQLKIEKTLAENGCSLLEYCEDTSVIYTCPAGHQTVCKWKNFTRAVSQGWETCSICRKRIKIRKKEAEIKDILSRYNYTLVGRYEGLNSKLSFICKSGHKAKSTWAKFYRNLNVGHETCVECSKEKSRQEREVAAKTILAQRGHALVGPYIDKDSPFEFKCNRGHLGFTSLSNFQRAEQPCSECRAANSLTVTEVQNELSQLDCVLVSFDGHRYEDYTVSYTCLAGHKSTVTWDGFRQRKKTGHVCLECCSTEQAEKALASFNCKLLVFEKNIVAFKCEMQHRTLMKWESCVARFRNGFACLQCKKGCGHLGSKYNIKKSQEEVERLFSARGCVLLDEYVFYRTDLIYRCKCGKLACLTLKKFKERKEVCKCEPKRKKTTPSQMFTQQEVDEIFAKRGCQLLEKFINVTLHKMQYKCKCGVLASSTLGAFLKRKYPCNKCIRAAPPKNILNAYGDDLRSVVILGVDECEQLLELAKAGDNAARNKLIESVIRFIYKVVLEFKTKSIPFEDLLAEANLVITEKVLYWEPAKGKLTTFLAKVVKNALRAYKWQIEHSGIFIPRRTLEILQRTDQEEEILNRSYNRRVDLFQASQAKHVVRFSDMSEEGFDPVDESVNKEIEYV